jgi:hypothetical protein
MTESQVVNRWIEKARAETRLEGARAFLLRALRRRFPDTVPPEVVETINAQPSVTMLEAWFDQAMTSASMDAFIAALRRRTGLGGWDMTESKVVNRWIEQARREGRILALRKSLLKLAQGRFPGCIPAEVVDLINRQDNQELLDEWFQAAISAASAEEFQSVLRR